MVAAWVWRKDCSGLVVIDLDLWSPTRPDHSIGQQLFYHHQLYDNAPQKDHLVPNIVYSLRDRIDAKLGQFLSGTDNKEFIFVDIFQY